VGDVEWVWGLLQPGFVRRALPLASHDNFNHCRWNICLSPKRRQRQQQQWKSARRETQTLRLL